MITTIIVGIYSITHIKSGKQYIGSSTNILSRWKRHRKALRDGKHHSAYLQNAWNKYGGIEAFRFEVVHVCLAEDLIAWEQGCLDNIPCEYNICRIAGNTSGVKHTPESIHKMREKAVGRRPSQLAIDNAAKATRGINKSDDFRAMVSRIHKGKTVSEETKQKLSDIAKRQYREGSRFAVGPYPRTVLDQF